MNPDECDVLAVTDATQRDAKTVFAQVRMANGHIAYLECDVAADVREGDIRKVLGGGRVGSLVWRAGASS